MYIQKYFDIFSKKKIVKFNQRKYLIIERFNWFIILYLEKLQFWMFIIKYIW